MSAARVLVIVEGSSDAEFAIKLFDRALVDEESWIEPDLLDSLRSFVLSDLDRPYVRWDKLREFVQDLDPRVKPRAVHGGFGGARGPDDVAARWARLAGVATDAHASLWLRDADQQPERAKALEREANEAACFVAWGCAVPMLEAWLLGCLAANEEAPNPTSQTPLPFDPIEQPHRLSATGGKHPAKQIASEFGLDDPVRRRDVLDAPLDALERCATEAGFPDFLGRIRQAAQLVARKPA